MAKVENLQEMTLKIDSLLPGTREMERHDCDYDDHGVSAPAHRAVLLQDFENSRSASHSSFCCCSSLPPRAGKLAGGAPVLSREDCVDECG